MADAETPQNDALAVLHLPHDAGDLFLRPNLQWEAANPDDHVQRFACMAANILTADYSYSVADGVRGVRLANQVAEKMGGEVEVLVESDRETPPGVVI